MILQQRIHMMLQDTAAHVCRSMLVSDAVFADQINLFSDAMFAMLCFRCSVSDAVFQML
jgi:hypothetical protein